MSIVTCPQKEKIEAKEGLSIQQVREKFLTYMMGKGHVEIQPVSLVPAPGTQTTLFTIAGVSPHMSKFANFIVNGTKFELGELLTNSQPCFRANDLGDIGDGRHTTCFEMLGNRSLNQHSKKEQLELWYGFLIEELGLNPNKLYQTVYVDEEVNIDQEVVVAMQDVWNKYGVHGQSVAEPCLGPGERGTGMQFDFDATRIFPYTNDKNRWQRGDGEGELGGTCSETFIDTGRQHDPNFGEYCHPNCDCGRFIEIGNSVFMQYIRQQGEWQKTDKMLVDFGGGLERLSFATNVMSDVCSESQQGVVNVFTSDAFSENISFLEIQTGKSYIENRKPFEVICDHAKSISLLMKDGLQPSNSGQGSILRRLIRNLLKHGVLLGIDYINDGMRSKIITGLVENNIHLYHDVHPTLGNYKNSIENTIHQERKKMITIIDSYDRQRQSYDKTLDETFVFMLYERYGIPVEYSLEQLSDEGIALDIAIIERLVLEHKEKSKKRK